ncbi:hypothetical protein M1437_00420 [Patescibacteria group bacterium]|nr:hypothetical protein [Patescibacteria group bacterium]
MIIVLPILVLALISAEVFLFKQRSKNKANLGKVQNLNTKLNILKALSYVFSSKRISLKEDLEDIAVSFFVQDDYSAFVLIQSGQDTQGEREVWRYNKNQVANQIDQPRLSIGKINKLEEYLLAQASEKNKQNQKAGNVVWFNSWTGENLGLTGEETKWHSAVVASLSDTVSTLGQVLFLGEKENPINDEELNFLSDVGGFFTMVLRKWYINNNMPLEEQLKAASVAW